MSDVYTSKSYGELEVGFGDKIGILVVDFQRGFTEPQFAMGGSEHIIRAVANTARLLDVARARNAPVASCYVAYGNDNEHPHWKVGAVPRDLRRGSEAVELDPRIADFDYDYVFEKWGASAFFMTPLSSFFYPSSSRYCSRYRVCNQRLCACVCRRCLSVRVSHRASRRLFRRSRRAPAPRHLTRRRSALCGYCQRRRRYSAAAA